MRTSQLTSVASALSVVALTLSSGAASAATLRLGASTQAWYNQFGVNSAVVENQDGPVFNTFTGFFNGVEFRSYYVFDVGAIASPIASGVLKLSPKRYYSSINRETVTLYDVATPVDDLINNQRVATFDDLGNGEEYGHGVIVANPTVNPDFIFDPQTAFITITLTEAAIQAINQAIKNKQSFALGLSLVSAGDSPFILNNNFIAEGVLFSGGVTDPVSDNGFQSELILEEARSNPDDPRAIPELFSVWGILVACSIGLGFKPSPQPS